MFWVYRLVWAMFSSPLHTRPRSSFSTRVQKINTSLADGSISSMRKLVDTLYVRWAPIAFNPGLDRIKYQIFLFHKLTNDVVRLRDTMFPTTRPTPRKILCFNTNFYNYIDEMTTFCALYIALSNFAFQERSDLYRLQASSVRSSLFSLQFNSSLSAYRSSEHFISYMRNTKYLS